MKFAKIVREECGGELGPGLEHSSGSRFLNREGTVEFRCNDTSSLWAEIFIPGP